MRDLTLAAPRRSVLRRLLAIIGLILAILLPVGLLSAHRQVAARHPGLEVPWLPSRLGWSDGRLLLTYAMASPEGNIVRSSIMLP